MVSRYAPTAIFFMLPRPVGKSDACQPNSLSAVSGAPNFSVASSFISTTLSTLRPADGNAPASSGPAHQSRGP